MILSDREIKLALLRGFIAISPPPADDHVSSTSIDLTLHEELSFWNASKAGGAEPAVVRPKDPEFDPTRLLRDHGTTFNMGQEGFVLEPWAFVLGWTTQRIKLPHTSRIAARVEGRSALARLGVGVHVTAPTIHAGFGFTDEPDYPGTRIRLEIWNCGPLRVRLEPGLKVCQLILEEVHGTPDKGYQGAFATQTPFGALPGASPPPKRPETRKSKRHKR